MNFKLIPTKKVLKYLSESVAVSNDFNRKYNCEELQREIISGKKVVFCFENEYEEKYLCLQLKENLFTFYGDETDWDNGYSFGGFDQEKEFVANQLEKMGK